MVYVEDLIDELKDIPIDCLDEVQFVFRRYGVDATIIDEHLDIDLEAMNSLSEEERYYLYQDLYNVVLLKCQ